MIQKPQSPNSNSLIHAEAKLDTPTGKFRCHLVKTVAELESLKPAWERLVEVAIHRNLFFDPDFLIPAIKHLDGSDVQVLVVDAPAKSNPDGERVLCGLIPLKQTKIYGLPLSACESWLPDQSFDSTPLLRFDCSKEVLNCMLDFLLENKKTGLLGLNVVSNEGEFARVLTDVLYEREVAPFYRDSFSRACFRPELDFDTYLQLHLSKRLKQNLRRLNRRLEEKGKVTFTVSHEPNSHQALIDQFFDLEASGWKSKSGTALRCQPSTRDFFQEAASRSLAAGKMRFLSVNLDDEPISMLCDLYSDNFGYSYKTAFADELKEYSPGMMAELHNIQEMHERNVCFMDSCTMPDNATVNRIWNERIRFQSLIVPLHGRTSRWATSIMPVMQQFARSLRKTPKK